MERDAVTVDTFVAVSCGGDNDDGEDGETEDKTTKIKMMRVNNSKDANDEEDVFRGGDREAFLTPGDFLLYVRGGAEGVGGSGCKEAIT